MKKALALFVLGFLVYCWVRVAAKSRFYSWLELTIWGIIIGLGGLWCIVTLLS